MWHFVKIFSHLAKSYPTYARQNKDRITARTIHSTAPRKKKTKHAASSLLGDGRTNDDGIMAVFLY